MPKNLELKARIVSIADAVRRAHRIQARFKGILRQRDIYYQVSHGRLKLRVINGHSAELIFYNRPNKKGSKYSDYIVHPVSDMSLTNTLCSKAFGKKIVVEKKRRLFLYKNARLHLDEVRGLGMFIEFEVLVTDGKRQAQKLLDLLSETFEIKRSQTCAASYADLILRAKMK